MTGEYGAPEERFEDLVGELLGCPGVTPPSRGSGFGRSALRWEKSLRDAGPGAAGREAPGAARHALVSGGDGVRFDANKGTTTNLLMLSRNGI